MSSPFSFREITTLLFSTFTIFRTIPRFLKFPSLLVYRINTPTNKKYRPPKAIYFCFRYCLLHSNNPHQAVYISCKRLREYNNTINISVNGFFLFWRISQICISIFVRYSQKVFLQKAAAKVSALCSGKLLLELL